MPGAIRVYTKTLPINNKWNSEESVRSGSVMFQKVCYVTRGSKNTNIGSNFSMIRFLEISFWIKDIYYLVFTLKHRKDLLCKQVIKVKA